MAFVNRKEELAALDRVLGAGPSLIRVYGRRRLGKTEILREICKRRSGAYLLLDEAEPHLQRESLDQQLAAALGRPYGPSPTWNAFFEGLSKAGAPLVVFDEFQRLIRSDPLAITRLQHHWDTTLRRNGPSVVLCGSSVGMMQRLTRRPSAPLFGRLAADLRVQPFSYASVRLLHPSMDEAETVRRYAVFGGTPHYQGLAMGGSLEAAIERTMLLPSSPLLDEPINLLRLEIGAPARYHSVMEEIGGGTHDLGALESKLGVPTGRLSPYIALLRDDLNILRAENPVGRTRKGARYVFADPFFGFYYRFVSRRRAMVELRQSASILAEIRRDLEAHVGRVFEEVAAEALRRLNGGTWHGVGVEFDEVGRWWNRVGTEVDIVARGKKELLAGEVRWAKGRMDVGVLRSLEAKATLIEDGRRLPTRFVFVARDGFSPAMREEATGRGALLFDLKDLSRVFDRRAHGDSNGSGAL